MIKQELKTLLVTTSHKGVFFGLGIPTDKSEITLTDAQMCTYWDASIHGVMGLASSGPNDKCRIGPKVPKLTIKDITSIAETTKEAAEAWSKQPWS
jgi:hypothetical protein